VNLFTDFANGFKQLAKRPGFSFAVVLTLALGIGANSAIFSMINGLMLKPLPYPHGEQLVAVFNTYPKMGLIHAGVSIPDYLDRRRDVDAFQDSAMYTWKGVNLTGQGNPQRLLTLAATPSLFSTLQVKPLLGRVFNEQEATVGNDQVVVLSYPLWQSAFGGSRDVIGTDIQLDGKAYRIIGVMPGGFVFPNQDVQLWAPFAFTQAQMGDDERGREFSSMIARLRPGATTQQAQQQLDRIQEINNQRFPEAAEFWKNSGFGGRAVNYREELIGNLRAPLYLLQAAVAFVLLIACANVANLMLARVTARRRELSVRTAMGAGRWRIVRQLLAESLVLSVVGGVAGLLVAWFGLELLTAVGLGPSNELFDIQLDVTVLAFALGLAVATGLVFGVVPALAALRDNTAEVLKEGGRSASAGRGTHVTRSALVIAQVAIAAMLLVGSGLLIKSFMKLQSTSPGFNPKGLLTAGLSLPDSKYGELDAFVSFHDRLVERLQAIPGVVAAGMTNVAPFEGGNPQASYDIEGYESGPGENSPHGMIRQVDGGYFKAMQIPVLEGRVFEPTDGTDNPAAVIDETLAERYFPDENPIGRRIGFDDEENPQWFRVVGVVGTVKQTDLSRDVTKETYYLPIRGRSISGPTLVIRTAVPPMSIADQVREAVSSVDPELPLTHVRTMQEMIDMSLQTRRAPMLLLMVFAAVALTLSAVGIYGVLAYSVSQRTGELGVRMALGAQLRDVLVLVMKQGGRLIAVGLAAGLGAALLLSSFVSSQLYGVSRFDPTVLVAVIVFLGLVAALASLIPAWRAARVNPVEALKYE